MLCRIAMLLPDCHAPAGLPNPAVRICQSELSATVSELSATVSELSATVSELSATGSELSATGSELSVTVSVSSSDLSIRTERDRIRQAVRICQSELSMTVS